MDGDKSSRSDNRNISRISLGSEPRALVVVAHPDDETLWVGGTMLMHPDWNWKVVSLCRGNDIDRQPRFLNAVRRLGAQGSIGNVDDGPDQCPLYGLDLQKAIKLELDNTDFEVIITHSLFGEYTRHLRHEEVAKAVLDLWHAHELTARELWMFAYTDNAKAHYPQAIEKAHLEVSLPENIWREKRALIMDVYGFSRESWEAMTTPKKEAFWRFSMPDKAFEWQRRYASRTAHGEVGMSVEKGE